MGHFIKTADENIWRMEEVNVDTGERQWAGLLSVYVDDLLVAAENEAARAAMKAIERIWAISEVEIAEVNKPLCRQRWLRHLPEEVPAGANGTMENP